MFTFTGTYRLLYHSEPIMCNRPTPLRRAVRLDNLEALQKILADADSKGRAAFLINEDYAPDCIMQSCSKTIGNAFYYTVFRGRTQMVDLMLKYGADVYSSGYNGETPLHCAARSSNLDVVKMLIEHGCDPKSTDDLGRVALHSAARSVFNTTYVLRYLVEEKMESEDINMKDFSGRTPLHEAARYGCVGTTETLIELGSDVMARNNDGETPLDIAKAFSRTDVVVYLQEVEAKMQDLGSERV